MCTCTPINVGVAADLEANFTSLTPQTRNTDGDLQVCREFISLDWINAAFALLQHKKEVMETSAGGRK